MTTAQEFNRQGVELKRQGRLDEAAQCYEAALRLQPDFAEARYNLGMLWRDFGRVDLALKCLETTVALRPDVPLVHFECANLLVLNQQFDNAIGHYQQALALAPDFAPAAFNLANIFLEQSRWQEAELLLQQVLQRSPQDPDALVNLGTALQSQCRLDEAAAAFRQVIATQGEHAVALSNLGNVLKEQGQLDDAIDCYQRALTASPQLVAARINLGNTWLELGHFEAALSQYAEVVRARPNDPQARVVLGNALHRLDRVAEANDAYQQALQLNGNYREAWLSSGHLHRELGNLEQARTIYRELARRNPGDPLHKLREAACCPLVFRSRAELDDYRSTLVQVTRGLARADLSIDFRRLTVYAPDCPYNLQFLDGNVRPLKEAFAQVFASYFAGYQRHASTFRASTEKPRIGFVVTSQHESAFLKLLGGVVQRLDGRLFDLVVLCSKLGSTKIRAGIPRDDVAIVDFPERFDHIVDTVRGCRCDLLYYWEVGNDPTNYFLPFLRLAPIQITSWGIQVTSGIPGLDAYLSSDLVEVPEAQEHYTELLIRATTLLTYQIPVGLPARPKQHSDFGLAPATRIYGCLQNLGKFHPDFDATLAEILRRDTAGFVVVNQDRHGYAATILRQRWAGTIADVEDRILFFPPLAQADYLSLLATCDVLLDPLHFGGVTTTYDALALAKPLITLPTEFHRGRYSAACLRKIGVTDTIARDSADYADLAVSLAADRDRCRDLSRRLQEAKHLVFEDHGAVGEHERIFQELLAKVR